MKIKPVAAALAALGILGSGGAHASSLSFFGNLSPEIIGVSSQLNADGSRGNSLSMSSGNAATNSWGLKGSEDLGNGLSAVFMLESTFKLENGKLGQAGTIFGRQAFAGLHSKGIGSVLLGRQFDAVVSEVSPMAFSNGLGTTLSSNFGDINNLNGTYSLGNTLKFESERVNGLRFAATYSLGGKAGKMSSHSAWSAAASYENAGLALGAGYSQLDRPFYTAYGADPSSHGEYTGLLDCASGSYCQMQNAKRQRIFAAGAGYTMANTTVGAVYSTTRLDDSSYAWGETAGPTGDLRVDSYEVNLTQRLTPATQLGAAYSFNRLRQNNDGARVHQVMVGAEYALSKRTAMVMAAVWQKVRSNTDVPMKAQIAGVGISAKDHQTAVLLGLRHSF